MAALLLGGGLEPLALLERAAAGCPELVLVRLTGESKHAATVVMVKRVLPLPQLQRPAAAAAAAAAATVPGGELAEFLASEQGGMSPLRYTPSRTGPVLWLQIYDAASAPYFPSGTHSFRPPCARRISKRHQQYFSPAPTA